MRPQRGFLGSMSGGIFLIFLAIAFFVQGYFLPLLFVGLAFSVLFGSFSTMKPKGVYGGIYGFVWMLGLAFCFVVGFWPWILLVVAASIILGAFAAPIMAALAGLAFLGVANTVQSPPPNQQPYYTPNQPYQQPQQSSEKPYQQGYQPPPVPPHPQESYQEGGQQHPYPPAQQYDQPQTQYPQEMPPQQ